MSHRHIITAIPSFEEHETDTAEANLASNLMGGSSAVAEDHHRCPPADASVNLSDSDSDDASSSSAMATHNAVTLETAETSPDHGTLRPDNEALRRMLEEKQRKHRASNEEPAKIRKIGSSLHQCNIGTRAPSVVAESLGPGEAPDALPQFAHGRTPDVETTPITPEPVTIPGKSKHAFTKMSQYVTQTRHVTCSAQSPGVAGQPGERRPPVIGRARWSGGQKGNSKGKSDSSCKVDIIDLTGEEGLWGKGTFTHHVLSPDIDVLSFFTHLDEFGSMIAFVEVQGSNADDANHHAKLLDKRINRDGDVGKYGAYREGNSIIAYRRDGLIFEACPVPTPPEYSLCGYTFQFWKQIGGLWEISVAVVKSPLSRGLHANENSSILDAEFVDGLNIQVLMGNLEGMSAINLLEQLRNYTSVNVITHPWSYDQRIWWMGNIGRVHDSSPATLAQLTYFAGMTHKAKQNDSKRPLIQKVSVKKMKPLNHHHFIIGMFFGGNSTFRTKEARRRRSGNKYDKAKERLELSKRKCESSNKKWKSSKKKWKSSNKKWKSPKRMKNKWCSWWGNLR